MLSFIKETVSVWERLQQTDKPIVLYGMGNGADKIVDWCEANAVKIAGSFASDEFVRGQVFRGFKVER
ncbi:MAG: FkbM family methyltransferase, partial [Phascolarctobacterium sp.]|nr:FkbM family methyltransferase [Phascolarctobacterium sp.]